MGQFIEWLNTYPFVWPVFIFIARVADVTIGTMRMILVVRGHRLASAALGFIEVMVWLFAVAGVLAQEMTIVRMLAYAGGFAVGNLTGIWLEQRMALGRQVIQFLSRHRGRAVAEGLRLAGFRVTEVPARGARGEVAMCFVVARRQRTNQVIAIARTIDADVLCTVEDLRAATLDANVGPHPPTGWRAVMKKK